MNIAQVIAALQGGGNPDDAVIQAFQPGGAALPPIPGPTAGPPSSPFPPAPGSPPPAAPPAPPTTTVPTGAVTPVTNPIPADASPNALQSPPDLANMYIQLMQQNRNAAALDSGLTMIAAGLSPYEGTRKALIAASAHGAGNASNVTSADIINLQKHQQAMKDMLLRRSVLGGLGKQYNLSPETLVALETSGKLDEVIAAHNTGHVIKVTDAATGQESLHHAITGKEIAKIGGPKPEEGEFVEGATGRELRSKRTGLPMGGGPTGLPPTADARANAEMLDGINAERKAAGQPPLSMEQYLTTVKRDPQQPANAADVQTLAQINAENAAAGRPPVSMEQYVTTIKREKKEAPNAKDEAALEAINRDRKTRGIGEMGMEEYIRRYGKSGVTVNVGPQGQKFPEPPPGQDWKREPNGDVMVNDKNEPTLYDLPGSDAALKRKEHALKVEKGEREERTANEGEVAKARARYATVSSVSNAVDVAKDIIRNQKSYFPATGLGSSITAQFGGTSATDIRATLRTIDANTAFSQLQAMRDASTQGSAGLGSVTDFEQKMLSSVWSSLDPHQSDERLLANLNRNKAAMIVLAENDFKKGGKVSDAEAKASYDKAFAKTLAEVEREGGGKIRGDDVRRTN